MRRPYCVRSRTKKERLDVSRLDVSEALVVCAFISFLHCIIASLFGFEQSDLTLHEDMAMVLHLRLIPINDWCPNSTALLIQSF
jgi:hypothetical protein